MYFRHYFIFQTISLNLSCYKVQNSIISYWVLYWTYKVWNSSNLLRVTICNSVPSSWVLDEVWNSSNLLRFTTCNSIPSSWVLDEVCYSSNILVVTMCNSVPSSWVLYEVCYSSNILVVTMCNSILQFLSVVWGMILK